MAENTITDKKISIIIPVYNSEKFLKTCLNSLTKQSYRNMELIIVNDGSPSNCKEIAEEYMEKNNKRLIHSSTISISGFGEKEETAFDEKTEGSKIFSEQDLYVGQSLKGIYSSTKFKAEIAILEAIETGLDAQIVRIGNITNRYSDGLFQKNIKKHTLDIHHPYKKQHKSNSM